MTHKVLGAIASEKSKAPKFKGPLDPLPLQAQGIFGPSAVGLHYPKPAIDAPQPLSPVKTVRLNLRLLLSRTLTGVSGVTGALTHILVMFLGSVVCQEKPRTGACLYDLRCSHPGYKQAYKAAMPLWKLIVLSSLPISLFTRFIKQASLH